MKYSAVFFDLDGTVIDSLQDIVDAVNVTMRHFGLPEASPAALKPHLGWGVGTLMKRWLPDLTDEQRARVLAFYQPYYAAHAGDKSRPFPGIPEALARLRADGFRLAILSNKPDAAVQPLVQAYFSDTVSLAAGEVAGVRRKPDPDMLVRAAEQLGVELRRCLYVGDSEVDVDTARNAGIDCLCVSWGFRTREQLVAAGAKRIVDTPEEMAREIERVESGEWSWRMRN